MTESSFRVRMKKKRQEERRRMLALCLGMGIMLLAFGVYFLSQFESMQKSYLYPYPYREMVEQYAEEYKIDSSLVASVIMNESKFKNDVHSHRGAIGLMQLMPDTAEWIAVQLDDAGFSVERLHEPAMNIRYGTWYLASLKKEFKGNEVLALAAYNAGRGNVHEWMQENHWDMDFQNAAAIPYEETRAYVMRVLKDRQKYQELYGTGRKNES